MELHVQTARDIVNFQAEQFGNYILWQSRNKNRGLLITNSLLQRNTDETHIRGNKTRHGMNEEWVYFFFILRKIRYCSGIKLL